MELLNLPISTNVNRNVPKNAFDKYTNGKQKRQFTELVDKIRWLNKLSKDTVNLAGKDIHEIQVFHLSLKKKEPILDLLNIIDKAIPYHLVFIVSAAEEAMFSASKKHPHPTNEDIAVIDWTFSSDWFETDKNPYQFNLQQSLDFVFTDFCNQLAGEKIETPVSIEELVGIERRLKELNAHIDRLRSAIKNCRQFNRKVELNLELQGKELDLRELEEKMK